MTDMEKVKIHGVPETMMQTLFARAAHSQKKEHKFYDAKAIEIVKQLDYDFSKAEKDAAMSSGVIARHHSVGSDGGCLFRGTSGCNCC